MTKRKRRLSREEDGWGSIGDYLTVKNMIGLIGTSLMILAFAIALSK